MCILQTSSINKASLNVVCSTWQGSTSSKEQRDLWLRSILTDCMWTIWLRGSRMDLESRQLSKRHSLKTKGTTWWLWKGLLQPLKSFKQNDRLKWLADSQCRSVIISPKRLQMNVLKTTLTLLQQLLEWLSLSRTREKTRDRKKLLDTSLEILISLKCKARVKILLKKWDLVLLL
jgi:hypothetical protein